MTNDDGWLTWVETKQIKHHTGDRRIVYGVYDELIKSNVTLSSAVLNDTIDCTPGKRGCVLWQDWKFPGDISKAYVDGRKNQEFVERMEEYN